MVKKRGLGKSLDALLAISHLDDKTSKDALPLDELSELTLDRIVRGKYQPRREMDKEALQELANSIRVQGILQPLIVRPVGEKYEIIAGERRFQAAKLLGLPHVPAIIRNISDENAIAIALIENIQRENLNPVEEAIALDRLIVEFGMTHQQIAEAVGKSRATVTNLLRLLSLPPEIKALLEKNALEMGHARTLITLPEDLQLETAMMIVERGLNVREAEDLARRLQTPKPNKTRAAPHPDIARLQENLSNQLKLRVAIQCNAKGKGKLVIHYKSLRELDELLEQFG